MSERPSAVGAHDGDRVAVTIMMNADDFDELYHNATVWGSDWSDQGDRFEYETLRDAERLWEWKYVYFVGGDWTRVMMMRAFLEGHGHAYDVIHDTNEDYQGFAVLTDYASTAWRLKAVHDQEA